MPNLTPQQTSELKRHPGYAKVQRAIRRVMLRHPAWAHLVVACHVRMFASDDESYIASTDGRTIYLNLEQLAKFTDDQVAFVICHEVMHTVCDHLGRAKYAGMQNHALANAAADFVVNGALEECTGFTPPDDLLIDHSGKFRGKGFESIYWSLYNEEDKQGGGNQDPGPAWGRMDEDAAARAGDAAPPQSQSNHKEALRKAQEAAEKGPGDSGIGEQSMKSFARSLSQSLAHPIGLLDLIRDWTGDRLRCPPYWGRPRKKYMPSGLYMPQLKRNQVNNFVVAIDNSGSVVGKQWALPAMAAIARYVRDDSPHVSLWVVSCDTAVNLVQEVEPGDEILPDGLPHGGGTAFDPVFDWVDETIVGEISGLIYMTDMEGPQLRSNPNYPVLWLDVEYPDQADMTPSYREGRPGVVINAHRLSDITRFVS